MWNLSIRLDSAKGGQAPSFKINSLIFRFNRQKPGHVERVLDCITCSTSDINKPFSWQRTERQLKKAPYALRGFAGQEHQTQFLSKEALTIL
jgi:hypothetical protein